MRALNPEKVMGAILLRRMRRERNGGVGLRGICRDATRIAGRARRVEDAIGTRTEAADARLGSGRIVEYVRISANGMTLRRYALWFNGVVRPDQAIGVN
jgi:hypothetical protein